MQCQKGIDKHFVRTYHRYRLTYSCFVHATMTIVWLVKWLRRFMNLFTFAAIVRVLSNVSCVCSRMAAADILSSPQSGRVHWWWLSGCVGIIVNEGFFRFGIWRETKWKKKPRKISRAFLDWKKYLFLFLFASNCVPQSIDIDISNDFMAITGSTQLRLLPIFGEKNIFSNPWSHIFLRHSVIHRDRCQQKYD